MNLNAANKIGVWGFGLVGQSLVKYFHQHGYTDLLVYDVKPVDPVVVPAKFNFTLDLEFFLTSCDYIFPSPGVDLDAYQAYQYKFRSELDLFYQNWRQPIFAITGTLGKTTLTSTLASLLNQAGQRSIAAGNIGLPMLELLEQDYEIAVLELSSFQLNLARQFAPDLAVWTNFFPNHLDWHKTLANYFLAKAHIFLNQTAEQITLLPISLIPELINFKLKFKSRLYFFGLASELNELNLNYMQQFAQGVFILQSGAVILKNQFTSMKVGELASLSVVTTYELNLVVLLAIIYLKQIKLPAQINFKSIEHRLELFYVANNIDWYNDSKSTVPQATLAAVQQLSGRPIILFLGGISKGVNRAEMVRALKNQVKLVICFGGEAESLNQFCLDAQLNSVKFSSLQEAVSYAQQMAVSGDQILFSPAGASFDLFKNYVERGQVFKQLVLKQ